MLANLRQMTNRFGSVCLVLVVAGMMPAFAQEQIPAAGIAQIRALLLDKANRTPAQLKLDSQIIYNSRVALGQPAAVGVSSSFTPGALERSSDGLIHVDISADVTAALLSAIGTLGGRVESSFPQYKTIRAWIPLSAAETLAGRADVLFVKPAEHSHTNVASDTTGVIAHGANMVQAAGINGSGLTIGVLSDGVTALAAEQAAGRLPPVVNVISGQSGDGPGPCPSPPGTNDCPDEGTAMLEIVYSMAPGATLWFATAGSSEGQMATNILALQAAGCNIIVDDVTFFDESVFQDGTISAAVNTVTAAGALYFSSAANSGNLDSGTSGTWEGDFSPDGSAPPITETGIVHSFGPSDYDVLTSKGGYYLLKWSDPNGASCNDYDLFILDPTGTSVEGASTNRQTCSQDPLESIPDSSSIAVNSRIVIVNYNNAAPRAFHVDTERGRLSIGTDGATFGHNAAASALTVAAVSAATAGGGIFVGGTTNPPEMYSSDGPRKIFYDPSGNPITPGNFLFGTNGGTTLAKVDFTAADCVPSGAPDFTGAGGFCGTSAAAPHAASIAALIMTENPALTPAQVKNIMYTTSLHVSNFLPRTVGTGIVMAGLPPLISKGFAASTVSLNHSTGLTFVISNPNATVALSGVGFSDPLPSGLIVATPNGLSGSCGGGTITANAGSSNISLSGGTLAASGSCAFAVNVTATGAGVMNNVTSPISAAGVVGAGVGNVALATITVVAPPTIAKSFAAPTIPLHSTTNLTFDISNPNGTVSLSGIGFTDTLPAGLIVATPNGLSGSCGGGTITANAGSSSISLSGAALAAAAGCSFGVNVTGASAGVMNNVTSPITSTQGGTGSTASASITVVAPPTLAKIFAGPTVPLNHSTGLTFDISNPNGTVSLSGVGFTDTLPAGLIVATPNGLSGSCGGGTITANAGSSNISLSGAALGAGGSCSFTVNVTGTVAGIQNNTTSVVTSTQGGNGPPASDSITVVLPPVISKAFAAPTLLVGSSTALSFTITNPNPTVTLTAVGFTDTLPSGLVVATPNGLAGSCGGGTITAVSGSKSISLSGAALGDSASCTFAVNVTGTTAGKQVNTTGAVTSLEGATGNQASATITVLAPALIDYFSNANTAGAPDGTVRITNPGTAVGNLCANIFVSDANEELSECCSCTITPDGLLTLSVDTDLTDNALTGNVLTTGVITIIPVATIGGLCPLPTAMTPEPALDAWATHIQVGESGFVVAERASQTTAVSAEDLSALESLCTAIKRVGSGHGVCANSAALAAICNN